MKILPLFLIVILTACSRDPKLPEGVKLQVAPSGDVIITLDDKRAVMVRQNKQDTRTALVANLDGGLQVVQLEAGGATPRSMDLIGLDKARFSVMSHVDDIPHLIVDEDGDGLPDLKVSGKKKFRIADITWEEISQK